MLLRPLAPTLASQTLAATKDWLLQSTPSEREYFKHLLTLLDQNYEDWLSLQHRNMHEFLERSQEQAAPPTLLSATLALSLCLPLDALVSLTLFTC